MDYYNDYGSTYADLLGGFAAFGLILILLVLGILVTGIIANWKMFKKAGKGGWECIVPFYGYWVLTEIAGLEWWWFLLAISNSILSVFEIDGLSEISNLASLFASFNIYYNIARKFNKEKGISVLAGIFSLIFIYIFGFSKNEVYDINIPVSKNGVFGSPEGNSSNTTYTNNTNTTENVNTNNSYQNYSFCGNCGTKLENGARFCPNCGKENK